MKNDYETIHFSKKESRLYMSFMYVTFASLLIGGLMGLLQTLVRSGKYTLAVRN